MTGKIILLTGVLVLFASAQAAEAALAIPPGYSQIEFRATNVIRVPRTEPAEVASWMEGRRQKQVKSVEQFGAFHDFRFQDRIKESQITFKHKVVDDAGKTFKTAHYDHGCGVAVADVDGDGLVDVFFVNQKGSNELWKNLGNGKFENITDQAGVGLEGRNCVGASFGDVDNDGKPDLFVTTVRKRNVLFHNLGGGRFEDISNRAGVDYAGHSSGAVFFDYNKDGLLDLFVCNVGVYTKDEIGRDGAFRALDDAFAGHLIPARYETSILYQNLGNLRFKEASEETGLEHSGWSGEASFCDLDQDGYPELYVLNMSGDDVYYVNRQGKSFVNDTARTFGRTPWGSLGMKFFDYNRDGLMDLYVTDMHSDMSPAQTQAGKGEVSRVFEKQKSDPWCTAVWDERFFQKNSTNFILGSAFFSNQGDGTFAEISNDIEAETYWPWGPSVGDLNADGYDDIFVTAGMGYPFRYAINSVLLNEQGKRFFDSEFVLGIEPRRDNKLEIEYFKLNCSGEDQTHPYAYRRQGQLTVLGAASSRSSAIFDLDNDGDLDIVVGNMNDEPQVLVSNLSEKRQIRFLKVQLKGKMSNANGLGALVKVHSGSNTYAQYHDGKSGYLSQSLVPLYFGLGEGDQVDRIKIQWPSGKIQTLTKDIPVNGLITVSEAGD